jgi:hypothetical protein
MDIQTLTSSPRNERGDGQLPHLLLAKAQSMYPVRELVISRSFGVVPL